jgi:hypothetical protein
MGQADEASARQTAPPVGDTVFEAAVLDILERAEDDRDSERDVKRTERARQRAEHWASELTTRLALSPAQTARVLEIQTELVSALRQRGRNAPDGQFVPRQQRRAQSEALREQAEQQLRDVLDPQQVARYDQLDEELKIVRSTNAD